MPTRPGGAHFFLGAVVFCGAVVSSAACKRSERGGSTGGAGSAQAIAASASASAHGLPPNSPRCRVLHQAPFKLGSNDGGGQVAPSPIELGTAVAGSHGFAIGALEARSDGGHALIAVIDAEGARGRPVDLGVTHGGAGAPHLASDGNRLVAAVPDSDAAGRVLRLTLIQDAWGGPKPVWGGEVALGHGSDVFSIALGAEQGLVVWEGLDKKRSRGVIFGASFKRDDLSKVESRGVLSAEHGDFESPSLAVRPGGFWLASIERLSSSRDAAVSSREKKRSDSGDDEAPLVQSGPSVLQVVALDPAGAPLGGPVRITAPESRILVYDLASLPDGSGLLGWRAVDFAPGTEASSVQICRVAPDGSVKKYTVEADNLGAGAPSLLAEFEPGTKPKATAWLALGGRIDATRIMALGPLGDPLDELAREAVLRGSDPIALGNGRMLVARPRGATVELSVLMCEPGSKSH